MQSAHNSPASPADRTAELITFGVLYVIIGLLGISALAYMSASPVGALSFAHRPVATALSSLVGLTALVVLGVGSVRTTRWARAILLCGGSIALFQDLAGTLRFFLLQRQRFPGGSGPYSLSLYAALVVQLLAALATVAFYWREDVALTCARRDRPRWTDQVPLPVLSCCILAAQLAVQCLLFPFDHLNAIPRAVGLLAILAAFGLYYLQLWAWAGFLVLYLAWEVSTRMVGEIHWYAWVGHPLVALAFLLYARRYFVKCRQPAAAV